MILRQKRLERRRKHLAKRKLIRQKRKLMFKRLTKRQRCRIFKMRYHFIKKDVTKEN